MDNAVTTSTETLSAWLRNARSLCFFLPDGPYGKPCDNVYYFEQFIQGEDSVAVVLSGQTSLRFFGVLTIAEDQDEVRITGFSRLELIENGHVISSYADGESVFRRFGTHDVSHA